MERVTAQAIVRAPDGSSVLDADGPPDAATVRRHEASSESIAAATRALGALGFTVADTSTVTISFTGSRELFETTFGTTLAPTAAGATGSTSWEATTEIVVPAPLSDLVAAVVLPIEPTFST